MASSLAATLLDWYAQNRRALPWRESPSPYAVWVAEVMLQQTRVETVLPYYRRWMERFPNIASLAEASQEEVLRYWEGLGYYARARNLWRAARVLQEQYHGELPQDRSSLRKLPGIGEYTAGAIASIAFGHDEVTLDGNIRRVLARLVASPLPLHTAQSDRELERFARAHLPPGKAGEYNQALMDLGAMICLPRWPRCELCPLKEGCLAYQQGLQHQIPPPRPRQLLPHYVVTAAVIAREGRFLIAQRKQRLLRGLWEFPGGKCQDGESLEDCLKRELLEELNLPIEVGQPFGVYRHAYTHYRVTLHAFLCSIPNGKEPTPMEGQVFQWVEPGQLLCFPMGKIDRLIAQQLLTQELL
ncbi:MAG: A/G-specific adenine glycosylase [Anaerolineales bacterium]|nr:A/G-specific adenine glycosylase [Anaerolineales bacterium]MDW8162466.1 A/G-specific adenine glycosylase [Anaerolineales bacterium]